jgi:iron complex outermembrane recepter protein
MTLQHSSGRADALRLSSPTQAHRPALIVLGIVAALGVIPASAQDPIQEHVVVTATATPVGFAEVARSVVVLTREQIQRLPVRSVAELLAYVATVDVRTRGPAGLQADFSVRGASFGQTLVLVDGIRLNNPQSGHHNSDIPVLVQDIERVELLAGAGASLHGADAFGGAINIITRRDGRTRQGSISAGGDGFVDGHVTADVPAGGRAISLGAGFSRSDGFAADRDFRTVTAGIRAPFGSRSHVTLAHVDKDFGAAGFYGPSPSREWTAQTMVSADHVLEARGGWQPTLRGSYRTHGDRFLWDARRPGQFENRHRTHMTVGSFRADRIFSERTRLHVGADGGNDWISSSNLGEHTIGRGSVLAEIRHRAGTRASLTSGLRYDGYTRFGSSLSPSVAASLWISAPVKLRASAGHAFRVPTFTELYYTDPGHRAVADLRPERGWTYEAGADWMPAPGWVASATTFLRRDRDVIDWVRDTPTERWRTANVQRLRTVGLEFGARRVLPGGGTVDLQYAWLSSDADAVASFSKYVLDYARHRLVASSSLSLPWNLGLGGRLGVTSRVDGRDYALLDLRLSRTFGGRTRVFVEGTNLLDTDYQEIRGVDMPGRWMRAGLDVLRF